MAKRTGPSNVQLQGLIKELKKKAIEQDASLWKRIAVDLERPTRSRRIVNLSRLSRFTKEADIVVVPGKVLGSGAINHKLTIAAYDFSHGAIEKLKEKNCDVLSIMEIMQKKKPQEIRIIG